MLLAVPIHVGGWRKEKEWKERKVGLENSRIKHGSACSCCKSVPLPKCPLYWSARVKVPFSCESAPFHKYFTMPFLTPGGNTSIGIILS